MGRNHKNDKFVIVLKKFQMYFI